MYFIPLLIGGHPRHPREMNIPGPTPTVMPVWVGVGAFAMTRDLFALVDALG